MRLLAHIAVAACLLLAGLTFMQAKNAPRRDNVDNNNTNQPAPGKTETKTEAEIKMVRDSAAAGNLECQRLLGYWYFQGINVAKDQDLAAKWWAKAAKAGDAESTALLGVCFQQGQGVEADSLMAAKLFRKALKLGYTDLLTDLEDVAPKAPYAAMFLAEYYQGIGHTDRAKAEKFLNMAVDAGSPAGIRKLGLLLMNTKRYGEALEMFNRGVEIDDTVSLYYSGFIVGESRFGVKGDTAVALRNLTRAADMGHHQAQYVLGRWLDEGNNTAPDYVKARERWMQAARGGNDRARWSLGISNAQGRPGLKPNYTNAYTWLTSTDPRVYAKTFKNLFADTATIVKDTPLNPFVQGMKAMLANDLDDAIEWFTQMKAQDAPEAETYLAVALGFKNEDEKALVEELERMVKQDDATAMWILAKYLAEEVETPDKERIMSLVDKAIELGDAKACAVKAMLLSDGKIAERDVTKALELFAEADFRNGLSDSEAQVYAELLAEGGDGIEPDMAKAKRIAELRPEERRAKFLKAVPTSIK